MATKSTTRKTAVADVEETDAAPVEKESASKNDNPIIPKEVDLNELITVKNGYNGKLVYVSARTHERFVFDGFGDEQEIELRELRNAKSSAKAFFINNYFMFGPEYEWVPTYLGMGKFYKNSIKPDEFEGLFDLPTDEIKAKLDKLTDGQKKAINYMAREKIANGEIDSRKTISMLEESLGVQLIEK